MWARPGHAKWTNKQIHVKVFDNIDDYTVLLSMDIEKSMAIRLPSSSMAVSLHGCIKPGYKLSKEISYHIL